MQELLAEKKVLEEQLRDEQEGRLSAMATAMRGRRETAALKQVIEAVGCKIRINNLAPHPSDASDEGNLDLTGGRGDNRGQTSSMTGCIVKEDDVEKRQLSVSLSMHSDMDGSADIPRRPCGAEYNSTCRLRPGESCRWPQTGCARIGSAFIGLRADFDAFERLAILESYFDSEQEGERDVQQPPLRITGVT